MLRIWSFHRTQQKPQLYPTLLSRFAAPNLPLNISFCCNVLTRHPHFAGDYYTYKEMADLENMLLEAAGRTSSAVIKRHTLPKSRFKGQGSYSDGGSESRDEDSDDDAHASAKKPSRSQSHVPLKKRLDPTKRPPQQHDHDNDDGGASGRDDAESSDESDVGSDLYKNEDDKQRLAKMTELEREMILSDRAAKKGEKEFKEQMRLKKMENAKNSQSSRRSETPSSLPSSAKVRSSARYAERTASKGDALSELRAKRMKQQNTHAHDKTSKSKASRTDSTSQGVSSGKRKPGVKASSSSSSQSQSESMIRSDSDRESSDHNGLADSDDDRNVAGSDVPTFNDIHEITLRRSKLAKWLNEPFFEELIVGCFVRIGIGKSDHGAVYRLCMIQSVDGSCPDRQDKIENRVTHKRLICVWGSDNSAARFQMSVVSDSAPLEKEYKQLMREIERTCSQMPSKQEVAGKREAIRKTNTYVYSAATVKQMLEEKKTRPLNIAVEKDRLKNQLEIAKSNRNEQEMDRIYTRLQELEATRQARDNDVRAKRLAEMNKKNKVENFKNLSELRRVTGNLKAGEDGYDPFSRRWTRSRNYYAAEHVESNEAKEGEQQKDETKKGDSIKEVKEEQEAGETPSKVGVKATEAALQAAAAAGKLIDTVAPVDHGTETNMLHDFELPISLAVLQKFGGPQGLKNGFLARKQQVEATVGCQVPENDGNRHVLTLTISDYKRRRGLL